MGKVVMTPLARKILDSCRWGLSDAINKSLRSKSGRAGTVEVDGKVYRVVVK